MDIKELIIKTIKKHKKVKVADITRVTGFSRAYINRFFNELERVNKIILLGKANKAEYVLASDASLGAMRKEARTVNKILKNSNLSEGVVLDSIKRENGIFFNLPKNIETIMNYAFTEMMNNAIEHSKSDTIQIKMANDFESIGFSVIDHGVGIYNNIMEKRGLKNELEAIQDLLKGKQTTAPKEHTGEGIFFTSKIADRLIINGSNKKLIFDNIHHDIFIKDIKPAPGTKVVFNISKKSKKKLSDIFKAYTNDAFEFSKTSVLIELYKMDTEYLSRSQARRVLNGLEKFKTIVLDFHGVDTVGQAFADEVFRVWLRSHVGKEIIYKNANENIEFMIRRAKANNL